MSQVPDLSRATFPMYRDAIAALPNGSLTRQQLLTNDYLLGSEGKKNVG